MRTRGTLGFLALTAVLALPARGAEDPAFDSSQQLWQSEDAPPAAAPLKTKRGSRRPKHIRKLTLDHRGMADKMAGAPRERKRGAHERPLVLSLPDPDGGFQRFEVQESPIMEPALAAAHPEIKTYSGRGIDSPASTIRFDLTPLGFQASVRGPEGMWYIDPSVPGDPSLYRSYYGRDIVDNPHGLFLEGGATDIREIFTDRAYYHAPDTVTLRGAGFASLTPIVITVSASEGTFGSRTVDTIADASGAFEVSFVADPDGNLGMHLFEATDSTDSASGAYDVVTAEDYSVDPPVGDKLRIYRLALLSDPTYASYFGPANVTAAKASLINRVTHVYEAETSIRLVLIANNDVLNLSTLAQMTGTNGPCGGAACFTATQAGSCAAAISRNRQVLGLLVGASSFDIGHMVMGVATGGGMASLGGVGGALKAQGCTSIATPVGDLFAVDYVSHEMGRQFSANHSFNGTQSTCGTNRNASTSVEPGSGSSIMGHAGMCQADDLQAHADPYWSAKSFDEITNFIESPEATNIPEVQMAALTSFDVGDSFQLQYNGKDSAPIVRGVNFTTAGLQTAILGVGNWPLGAASVTAITDTGFTVTFGGALAGTDLSLLAVVNCIGCTGFVGEITKGGATTHQGAVTMTGNSYPIVTAPAGFTIPVRTPFALTGSATDVDGDTLTYMWEQFDRGAQTGTALLNNTKTNGPLFRQFGSAAAVTAEGALLYSSPGENAPSTDPTRVFPDLAQILANRTNAESGTCAAGDVECFSEFLPTSAYVGVGGLNGNASPPSLNFRLTARDGRSDGGGVAANAVPTRLILAPSAGPFLVTAPNTAVSYPAASTQTVTWNVANTSAPPVNTANVRITLSVDGGLTYPFELAPSTPNDGSEAVLLPSVGTTEARVKIEALANVFFDVSNSDFTILAPPTVVSDAPAGKAKVQYSDSLSPTVTVSASDDDSPASALVASAAGLPEGLLLAAASASDDATRPGTATWTVAGKVTAAPGTYDVTVTVTDDTGGTATTSLAIVVKKENAEAIYTGDTLAFTSPGSLVATVLLRATVRDSSLVASFGDTEPGDIAKATVSFNEGGSTLCGPLPLALLDGPESGTASCSVALGLGTHSIEVVVDGYYTGAVKSLVEVAEPEVSGVQGVGDLVLASSGGAYSGDADSRMGFALNARHKAPNHPKSPKGHVKVVFEAGGRSYRIESATIDSLGIAAGHAEIRATASLLDVTETPRPAALAANLSLHVTVTDKGKHGSGDTIGVTLWNGDALLFSSRWTGSRTAEQTLAAGHISVR